MCVDSRSFPGLATKLLKGKKARVYIGGYMMDLTLHEDWHCAQCLLRVCKEESGEPWYAKRTSLTSRHGPYAAECEPKKVRGQECRPAGTANLHDCSENNERKSTDKNITRRKVRRMLLDFMSLSKPRKTLTPLSGAEDLVPEGGFTILLRPCDHLTNREGSELGASTPPVLNKGRPPGRYHTPEAELYLRRTVVHHKLYR